MGKKRKEKREQFKKGKQEGGYSWKFGKKKCTIRLCPPMTTNELINMNVVLSYVCKLYFTENAMWNIMVLEVTSSPTTAI